MHYSNIDFNNKSILITGGAGFIGSNLAFYFQENYPQARVVVLDIFRNDETFSNGNLRSFGHFKNLLGFRGEIISADINSDLEKLKSYKFDYIFHEAAISDTTVSDQKIMIETNLNAFEELLKLALEMGADMIYASSAAVYGKLKAPHSIGTESPENIYGFSKLAMDHLAKNYYNKGINIVGLRYFNVYGEREFFKAKTSSMVVQFAHQMLSGKAPRLFEGSDKIKRDFIYVEDIIQANIKACGANVDGVYNVGTGYARSFKDIVDILQKELGTSYEYEYIPNPYIKQYQFFTEADISKSIKELKYKPHFSLEEGIRAYLPEIKRLFDEEIA